MEFLWKTAWKWQWEGKEVEEDEDYRRVDGGVTKAMAENRTLVW